MNRVVTEHNGIKYSLQPHGLKSRLLVAFFIFVVAFGGALLVVTSTQADANSPRTVVSDTPTVMPASPTSTPAPSSTPTLGMAPAATVTVTKTVFMTTTVTKTVFVTKTKDYVEAQTFVYAKPSSTPTSTPKPTPTPTQASSPSVDTTGEDLPPVQHNPLRVLGIFSAVAVGAVLMAMGISGVVKRRSYQGSHHIDSSPAQVMPVVAKDDDYSISDYNPNTDGHDPALGGYAGESYHNGSSTEELPPVE